MVDFWHKVLGTQNATLEHLKDYENEIASSRTFENHELEILLENGLIQGGDLNNLIVLLLTSHCQKKPWSALKKTFNKTEVLFDLMEF